ncbi:hypothetical protein PF010_g23204 [Phytophthora fragariae]|uniref:RING-type domain-containing protein n=1 Tax=Phytophthora fragariae TaxID=53985 RepID=A0A6G0K6C5_9STRA|nr:hypothetical protein PF010_g23204 [Phytophthora fragariae]
MASATQRVTVAPTPLDASCPDVPVAVAQDFPALCQICLDAPASIFQLCGAQCLAELCESCVVRYLTASVYAFYPGVLPKVRCPVCLTLLNRNQWHKFVLPVEPPQEQQYTDDNSHVLDKYVTLCRQSCGFQSPCCHNEEYTMLPQRYAESEDGDDDDDDDKVELVEEQLEALPELCRRCVELCYHREEVADFYEFLSAKFDGRVEAVLWQLLPKIVDEERRAALLLRHLRRNPDTQTHCCGAKLCFKCKAVNHHGGDCGDFIEDENVVECRGCGVTVVMVDGCDTLRCLCGFSFSWAQDVARQRTQRKQLAPVENSEYDLWRRWRNGLNASLRKISDLKTTQRQQRLARLVRQHRQLLRRVLLPRVFRYRLREKAPENATEDMIKLKSVAGSPLADESRMLSRSP